MPPAHTKQVQTNFLTLVQSYKNLLNTTYSTIQNQPTLPSDSPSSMQLKHSLVADLYDKYRQTIDSIDSLEEVDFEDARRQEKIVEEDDSDRNSMINVANQQSAYHTGIQQQKHELYEKEICESHDTAVKRYKQAIKKAQIWRQHLYKYINQNMPSGNH